MRHLGQVSHEDLVGDGLAQRHRQLHRRLLEFLAVEDALHRHDLRLGVRHLDTDGSLAGDGRDDADAECREREGDVILQVANLGDAYARGRRDLVERDGRAHGGLDAGDLNAEGAQDVDDLVLVLVLLLHVDAGMRVDIVVLQQVEGGVAVVLQIELRVVGLKGCHALFVGNVLFLCRLNGEGDVFSLVGLRLFLHGVWRIACSISLCLVMHGVVDGQLYVAGLWHRNLQRRGHGRCRLRLGNAHVNDCCCSLFRALLCLRGITVLLGEAGCDAAAEVHDAAEHWVALFQLAGKLLGMQQAADDADGFGTEIAQVGQQREEQDDKRANRSHEAVEELHDAHTMVTAWADVADGGVVGKGVREEEGCSHANPAEQDSAVDEPLPQAHIVCPCQLQRCCKEEDGDEEGAETEVSGHPVIAPPRSDVSGPVLGLPDVAALQHLLVLAAGEQVRHEAEEREGSNGKQQHTADDARGFHGVEGFVLVAVDGSSHVQRVAVIGAFAHNFLGRATTRRGCLSLLSHISFLSLFCDKSNAFLLTFHQK